MLYPEAGGSSSFARHAFNEMASFLAAWAQMLTYIVTVAISAFFVPHYLAVFWEPLGHGPGDVIFGDRADRGARAAQHQGDRGVGAAQPGPGDRRPPDADRAGRDRADPRLRRAICSSTRSTSGWRRRWGDFALGIAVGMVAYTGIETISNMAEEASSAHRTIPRGTGASRGRGGRAVRAAAGDRAVGDAGEQVNGEFTTELGTTFADDPVLGIVENLGLGVRPDGRARGLRRGSWRR